MAEPEFRITRVPLRSVSLLQIDEDDSRAAMVAARSFGTTAGGDSEAAGPRAFAIGPTEWLLVDYPIEELRRRLLEHLGRALVRVTDISAAFVSFRVEGQMARTVLGSDVGAPSAAQGFRPGQYVRTRLARVDVILHCIGNDVFELFADRTIAEHLEGWLAAQYAARARGAGFRSPGSRIQ